MAQPRSPVVMCTVLRIASDILRLVSLAMQSHAQLAAENLFLRKQLALYVERQAKPRRADDATRIVLVALSSLVEWRRLLTIVNPETLEELPFNTDGIVMITGPNVMVGIA